DEELPPWAISHPQPRSGVRRSQLWRGDDSAEVPQQQIQPSRYEPVQKESRPRSSSLNASYAVSRTEPNQRKHLTTEEQHKLDLLQQIEENKRRRELEKQKEREEEEREIRRLEKYNEKVRREEEEERRKAMERARIMEKHSEEVRESNYRRAQHVPSPRRRSSTPQKERSDSPSEEQPRLEWWEKKPTWQQRAEQGRQSAVIPTLRDKPPRTPSATHRTQSRHSSNNYDPAASVERHNSASRTSSRASHRSGAERQSSSTGRQNSSGSQRSSRRMSSQVDKVRA
ncbi:hypothetical protein OESDEN_00222, partial [Oesophagostomum dentatum]